MASVLLSASVERCFISRMRDFCVIFYNALHFLKSPAYKRHMNLSTDANSSTHTKKILLVRQNSPKNHLFRAVILHPLWANVFKSETTCSQSFPKDSKNLKCLDIGLGKVGTKRLLNGVNKWERKKSVKTFFCRGNFTRFMSQSFQIWGHFFSLLFPKDFEDLKNLDIGLWEVGAKRCLNSVNKVWRADRQTHIWTNRLMESTGPEGQALSEADPNRCNFNARPNQSGWYLPLMQLFNQT